MPTNKKLTDKNSEVEHRKQSIKELEQHLECLSQEAKELDQKNNLQRLEYDVIKAAAEIIKKGQGVNNGKLSNREKAILINALRNKYSLKYLLECLHMAKSSYFY
jgi:TolA-binding protein